MTNRTITTAAHLNKLIQDHIDSRPDEEYNWHSNVYLQSPDHLGCNWNIGVNCNGKTGACGASLSMYLDQMRMRYVILADDPTAVPAYLSRRSVAADAAETEDDRPGRSVGPLSTVS